MSCDLNTINIEEINDWLEQSIRTGDFNQLFYCLNVIFDSESGEMFLEDIKSRKEYCAHLASMWVWLKETEKNRKAILKSDYEN